MADFYNIFGEQPSYIPSLLGEDEADRLRKQAQQSGLMNLGLSLLAGAGPQSQRQGIGQLLAQGVMAGQQASRNAYEQAVRDQLMQEQIAERQQARQEQKLAQTILPQILRPGQELYGEDIMGQKVGVGVGAPQLDMATLQKLLTAAPSVAAKVLPTIETYRKLAAPETPQFEKLGPEERLINKLTGQVFAYGPKKEEKPAGAVLEAMQVLGINVPVEQLTPQQRNAITKYIDRKAEQGAPKVAVNMSDPTAVAKQQLATMNQWQGVVKDSGDATVAVRAAAFYDAFKLANEQNNPSADSALIYNLAKIYDSTGAVQQGDIKTIVGNPSIPVAVQKLAQRLTTGGTFIPKERENMKKIVEGTVREREKALKPILDEYRKVNKGLGGNEAAIQNPYDFLKRQSLDDLLGQ